MGKVGPLSLLVRKASLGDGAWQHRQEARE